MLCPSCDVARFPPRPPPNDVVTKKAQAMGPSLRNSTQCGRKKDDKKDDKKEELLLPFYHPNEISYMLLSGVQR